MFSTYQGHNMVKKQIFALGAALALCSTGAFADTFTFDPTGTPGATGNISGIGLFDQTPGNALAINGSAAFTLNTAAQITVLYQANLGVAYGADGSTPLYVNGQGGTFFTFVAGFGEKIIGGDPAAGTAVFGFDPTNTTNYYKVYATTSAGNNLTGTGFTSTKLIMQGLFDGTGFASNYSRSVTDPNNPRNTNYTQNFDQSSNGNQYGTFQSVVGAGSTKLNATVTYTDTDYFPDLLAGSSFSFFNTSQVTPFTQVDPSQAFINLAGTQSAVTAPGLGAQNGGIGNGPNFQLQADANQSFTRVVPEPDSLLMLGLGLGLISFLSKRRKQA